MKSLFWVEYRANLRIVIGPVKGLPLEVDGIPTVIATRERSNFQRGTGGRVRQILKWEAHVRQPVRHWISHQVVGEFLPIERNIPIQLTR